MGGLGPDNVVSLSPYFKINYGRIPDFKENGKDFYKLTKTETKMLYYGFSYQVGEGFLEHERCTCVEGYSDGQGLENHLNNVGATFGKALSMSALESLIVHAPSSQMPALRANETLKGAGCQFFTLDGKGFRRSSGAPYDRACILVPYFKIQQGKVPEFQKLGEKFYELTKKEKGVINYGFSYDDKTTAHCREAYVDAKALSYHLENVGETFGKALEISELLKLDVYAPADQLEILKENKTLQSCKAHFFVLDSQCLKN